VTTNQARTARLRDQIIAFTATRTIINTGHRMVYPFLPTFARGVGVDLDAVALAVTARYGLGIISPVFGSLADRRWRRAAMITGALIFAAGLGLVAIWPSYPALFVALLLATTGKFIYDPAMQAYIGDRVAYTQRGLAIALTEFSWSGAFLLLIPILGWLIDRTGWWAIPFPILAVLSLLAALLLWWIVPSDMPQPHERPQLAQGIRLIMQHTPALAGLAVGGLISSSNEVISIIFGEWLEDAFGLKVAALGAASAVIGIAELTSEGAVAAFVDRLGKHRAVALGIGGNMLASLLLPVLGFNRAGALVGLFLLYVTFEFALVSLIPLMTELTPDARATLMAGNVAALSAGRMVGALIGPPLFGLGLLANSITAAVLGGIALVVLLRLVRQE